MANIISIITPCYNYNAKRHLIRTIESVLATRIRGAFPSKVFDILPQGLPIIFCGGGEGAKFVSAHKVGYVSAPSDYSALIDNILRLRNMDGDEYEKMSERCLRVSKEELQFEEQMERCYVWLSSIC